MKNILIIGVLALVLFAASAGLSLYLTSLSQTTSAEGGHKEKEHGKEKKEHAKHKEPHKESKTHEKDDIPSGPLLGDPTVKATEEAVQVLARMKSRMGDIKQREADAIAQEQRAKIVQNAIRTERAEIDTLRKQLSAELGKLDERQQGIEKKARSLAEQKQAAEKLLSDLKTKQDPGDKNEGKNIAQLANISDSMPPDKAARILKQMADSGEIDLAVKLLAQMQQRRAAAVLAEITDVALSAQLMEGMRKLKRPSPATVPNS